MKMPLNNTRGVIDRLAEVAARAVSLKSGSQFLLFIRGIAPPYLQPGFMATNIASSRVATAHALSNQR